MQKRNEEKEIKETKNEKAAINISLRQGSYNRKPFISGNDIKICRFIKKNYIVIQGVFS